MREIFDSEQQRVPIKAWLTEIDAATLEQTYNLARLPFAVHHVALMPDAHLGYGMPIGGVLAADGVVVPNAVGVDIGCFTGDTRVPLASGIDQPLGELADRGDVIAVYSVTRRGAVTVAPAIARRTREGASLVCITLDNGERIRCTPDHRFMLLDGSYRDAERLPAGTILMPFRPERDRDRSPLSAPPCSSHSPSVDLVMAPTRAERDQSRRPALAAAGDGQARNACRRGGTLGPPAPAMFRAATSAHTVRPCRYEAVHRDDRTVVSVEELDEREDVYCLSVPMYGNFALSAGVFVHNCGMHARRTNIEAARLTASTGRRRTLLRTVLDQIQRDVPAGNGPVGNHRTAPAWEEPLADMAVATLIDRAPAGLRKAWDDGRFQIGTLGGGNHFIEIQADDQGFVWLMLHSGSRALGKRVCDHFNVIARDLDERLGSPVPRSVQLAHLPAESAEGREYLAWMRLCMSYALENRRRMLDAAVEAVFDAARGVAPDASYLITEAVDTHHNYADLEHHFGMDVLVHRKGAVRARAGEMVIIPGSMETGSYIARGLGNAQSFETASHGAGRRLSRTAAKKQRSAEDVLTDLRAKGIEIAKRAQANVAEEAGHAYKDIEQVMEDSRDLVEPVYRLRPLGVVKG